MDSNERPKGTRDAADFFSAFDENFTRCAALLGPKGGHTSHAVVIFHARQPRCRLN
jgi:hypothetical protein